MILQWLAAIAVVVGLSANTWAGEWSQVRPHVWAALLLGGAIMILTVILWRKAARSANHFAGEMRYRSLVTAFSQVVWTTDAEGHVEDIPQWRELTGQSLDEVKGFGWLDALHAEDRERVSEVWREAVRTRSAYSVEYRIRKADGSYGHYTARGIPVMKEDGSIREWVGICLDISERKLSEEALVKAREELELRVEVRTAELAAANEGLMTEILEREQMEAERQVISEIVQGVITTTNLDELLNLARRSIGKLLYAENCFIALHDTATDLMHFEFWVDKFDPAPQPRPVGKGFSSYILRTGRPFCSRKSLKSECTRRAKFR